MVVGFPTETVEDAIGPHGTRAPMVSQLSVSDNRRFRSFSGTLTAPDSLPIRFSTVFR